MNSTIKTFEAGKTQFFSSHDKWLEAVRDKSYYLVGNKSGVSAQDANGCCRGYWGWNVGRGWMERVSDNR